jgi:hypothetical protein
MKAALKKDYQTYLVSAEYCWVKQNKSNYFEPKLSI